MFQRVLNCLAVISAGLVVNAQEYSQVTFTTKEGLSTNKVITLSEHRNGEIWMGTENGIVLYDGLRFEYLSESDGLPSNVVYSIQSSSNGGVAIGTFNGLALLKNKRMEVYRVSDGLPGNFVYSVFHDGNMTWVGTDDGVAVVDSGKVKEAPFGILNQDKRFNVIAHIDKDARGRIWFSTGGNFTGVGSGVFVWDGNELIKLDKNQGLTNNRVIRTIMRDDRILVCSYGGVAEFDNDLNFIRNYSFTAAVRDEGVAFAEDAEGNLWVAGFGGLYQFIHDKFHLIVPTEFVENKTQSLVGDSEGNIWWSRHEKGVTKLSLRPFVKLGHEQGVPDKWITRFQSWRDSLVLVASESGLESYNIRTLMPESTLLSGVNVRSILAETDERVWVGLNQNPELALWENGKVLTFSDVSSLPQTRVFDIVKHRDTLFLATIRGIAKFSGAGAEPIRFAGLDFGIVNQLSVDDDGIIWLATNERGLYKLVGNQPELIGESRGLNSQIIRSIYRDASGGLWVLTGGGVYKQSGNRFIAFPKLTSDGQTTNSIVAENDSVFWLGRNSIVSRVVFRKDSIVSIRNYASNEGFEKGECSPRAILKDKNGRIWFGTNGGVYVYLPEFDRINSLPPKLRFTDVMLFQIPTDWSQFGLVDEDGNPVEVSLPYDKNYLSFRFKGVTHVDSEEVVYSYRMIGVDEQLLETKDRKVDYNNLPPGKYVLEVTCRNKDGFSTPEPIRITVRIRPPFWQTWWFYLLIIAIISAGVFSYFQIRRANFKISQINKELNVQKEIISMKNKDIMDSIHYARRIQNAVLPPPDKPDLPGTFLLYLPKDVVSGDFYWFFNTEKHSLFAVADCTGHGVPGAFMSIIGYNLLDKIAGEYGVLQPAEILNRLNSEISRTLHQKSNDHDQIRDGMDIVLCCYHKDSGLLEFAGAMNRAYIVRNNEIIALKGDRMPIGTIDVFKRPYTNQIVQLEKGDVLYASTDGIIDQFGANGGGKFKSRRLESLLLNIHKQPIKSQRQLIEKAFLEWKGNEEQIDDVLILGTTFNA